MRLRWGGFNHPIINAAAKFLIRAAIKLASVPHAFSLLAYSANQPVGLANCFDGFSTFKGLPLINIHDLVVVPPFRGQGIGQMLLKTIQDIAVEKGCCKLTLEVLSNNARANSSICKNLRSKVINLIQMPGLQSFGSCIEHHEQRI